MSTNAEIELELPRDASAAGRARQTLRQALPSGVDGQRANDVLLVVSELVSNAVEHGEGLIRLRLRFTAGRVAGEVVDEGTGFEREVREAGVEEIRGRGLALVDALSSRWGVHEGTTHVWFEIDLSGDLDPPSGPALGASERPERLPPSR